MEKEDLGSLATVIEKAWTDDSYKEALVADPEAVLSSEGISLPQGVRLRVVEDTGEMIHLVLPARPVSAQDLKLYDLNKLIEPTYSNRHTLSHCPLCE
jgi:Nitrile hydratase, alpha chain